MFFCRDSPGKTLAGNFFIAAATVFSKKYKHQSTNSLSFFMTVVVDFRIYKITVFFSFNVS